MGLGFFEVGMFRSSIINSALKKTNISQFPISFRLLFRFYRSVYGLIKFEKFYGIRMLYKMALVCTKKKSLRFVSADGLIIYLDLSDERFIKVISEIERQNADTRILEKLLKRNDIFLDAGANHGSYSVVASKIVGKKGVVVSFEPQGILANSIYNSMKANSLSKFEVHNVALGEETGKKVSFFVPKGNSGLGSLFNEFQRKLQKQKLVVNLVKLDDFIENKFFDETLGNMLLKIDVEGGEISLLKGGKKFIDRYKPLIIIEINYKSLISAGKSFTGFLAILEELSYNRFAYIDKPNEILPANIIFSNGIEGNIILFP